MNVQRGPVIFSTASGPVPPRLASAVRERVAQLGNPVGNVGRVRKDATAVDDTAINNPSETSRAIAVTRVELTKQRRVASLEPYMHRKRWPTHSGESGHAA
jgi:hypothetical protein